MKKSELIALAQSLGLSATEDMTNDQLIALIATYKPAVATQPVLQRRTKLPVLRKGKSVLKGFNYAKTCVLLVFADGMRAKFGTLSPEWINTAKALKGSEVEYNVMKEAGNGYDYPMVWIDCIS